MQYNFPGIAGAATDLHAVAKVMDGEFQTMQGTVGKLGGSWSSEGSMSWMEAQRQMMAIQAEVNAALPDVANRLAECGVSMQGTDNAVKLRFMR